MGDKGERLWVLCFWKGRWRSYRKLGKGSLFVINLQCHSKVLQTSWSSITCPDQALVCENRIKIQVVQLQRSVHLCPVTAAKKSPQVRWFETTEIYHLTVLKALSPKSRYWQRCVPPKPVVELLLAYSRFLEVFNWSLTDSTALTPSMSHNYVAFYLLCLSSMIVFFIRTPVIFVSGPPYSSMTSSQLR